MKDKRPPGKGGPRKGAKGGPKSGAGAGFRGGKPSGARFDGPARGPRPDRAGPGGAGRAERRFEGPRPPRGRAEGGDKPFDRSTERPFREPRSGGRTSDDGAPRGRRPYPPRDGAQRYDRDGPSGQSRGGRNFRRNDDETRDNRREPAQERGAERRFSSRAPRRDAEERSEPRRDFGGDFERRPRRFEARTDERPEERPRRDWERRDEHAPRFDRAGNNRTRDERPHNDRGRGGQEQGGHAPLRAGKPKPGAEQRIVGREKARRAQSLGDDGSSLWLYGKHAVAAALANPQRKIKRLLAAEGALAWLASVGVAKERAENAEQSSTDEIDLLLHPGAVHQGLAALVEDLPRARLREECAPEGGLAPVVVLDQITDPQNIGAIMRTAAAFGAKGVIVQDRRTPPLAGALAKAAAGAVEQVACVKVVNVARAIEGLKDLGYYCAGLAGEAEAPISAIPKDRPVALVLGAEGEGLRRLVAETCDGLYKIPIAASVDSLNVSTAAAVSLYAVTR